MDSEMMTMTELHKRWLNEKDERLFKVNICGEPRSITGVGVPIFNIGGFYLDVLGLPWPMLVMDDDMLQVGQ